MLEKQVQIPDELFERAKQVTAVKESCLPEPMDLGLVVDPSADPNWREEANLGSSSGLLSPVPFV